MLSHDEIFTWSKRVEPRSTEALITDFISKELKLQEVIQSQEDRLFDFERELEEERERSRDIRVLLKKEKKERKNIQKERDQLEAEKQSWLEEKERMVEKFVS